MEFVLFACWALYFLPFAVSAGQTHEHALPILLFNAFAGWTGVGWVLALIWALHPSPYSQPARVPASVISLNRPSPSRSG